MRETPETMGAAIGKRIREIRLRRKLPQRTLARRSGVSRFKITRIENAQQTPDSELLAHIADALKVPLLYLYPQYTSLESVDALLPFQVENGCSLSSTPPS